MYTSFMVRGKPRYMRDGKLIKASEVPPEEIERLNKGSVIEQPEPKKDKGCIFCGAHSRYTRFVDGQTVYVCDDHYYSETIGKVAQRLRSAT
jgi:hypothetical protein